jgi:hypothetical protein
MHGPTCIFWVNLTPFSLQRDRGCPGLRYAVCDCRTMAGTADGSVASVLDKGTLDAFVSDDRNATLLQIRRVLRLPADGGAFVSVTVRALPGQLSALSVSHSKSV